MNLRGVGIFHIDMIDYTDTPEGAKMRRKMFSPLPPTKNTFVPQDSDEIQPWQTGFLEPRYVTKEI